MSHILEAAADCAWNDTSPEGCAARRERISAAQTAALIRERKLSDARALIRSAGVRDERELLLMLCCVTSAYAYPGDEYAGRLADLCCDMDDAITEPEPELLGVDKRGEYDAQTIRSNRA